MMSIKSCPSCGTMTLDLGGAQGRCPACGAPFPAPPIVKFLVKTLLPVLLCIGGAACLAYGLWQDQPPLTVSGGCSLFLGVLLLLAAAVPNYKHYCLNCGSYKGITFFRIHWFSSQPCIQCGCANENIRSKNAPERQ